MEYLSHFARYIAAGLWLAAAAPAQVAILQIQVVQGEGTVHAPGVRANRPVTVAVTDEGGKPVSGAAVSFHLPEDGPGGTFVNGLRTDVAVTDGNGRASVRTFQANRLPGRFQIRIVASKEQARAGTVSFQYVGEGLTQTSSSARTSRKWVVIAAAAAGSVIAGALAWRGTNSPQSPVVPPAATPAIVLTIGTPIIGVGKP